MANILKILDHKNDRLTVLDVLDEKEQNGNMSDNKHIKDMRNENHPLRRAKDYVNGQRRRRWSKPERAYRLSYRRRPLATAASTAIAVVASGAIAYGTANVGSIFAGTQYDGAGWATCAAPITYTLDVANVPDMMRDKVRSEIDAAFTAWSTGSGYTFLNAGESPTVYDDAASSVSTVAEINRNIAITFLWDKDSTTLTKTTVGFAGPSKVFTDSKEIVGGYAAFNINYLIKSKPAENMSLFTHEIGHALGLGHSEDKDNIMYSMLDSNPSLGSGDVSGLRSLMKECKA